VEVSVELVRVVGNLRMLVEELLRLVREAEDSSCVV